MTPALAAWRARTDGPLVVLTIGTLPLLVLELVRHRLSGSDQAFLEATNVVLFVVFGFDYVVELVLARDRRAFVRHEIASLLVVGAQGLALVPGLAGIGALRALRAHRALRTVSTVLRLIALGRAATREGRTFLRQHAAGVAFAVAGMTWIGSAVAFTIVEDVGQGGRVPSFFDALWWSTATISTVGYGDVVPITPLGRIVGGITMFVGVSTLAVVTAKFAEFLLRQRDEPDVAEARS